MYTLDFHGDDYGISRNNCVRFMELIKAEKIDSISILPNMAYFDSAMKYLNEEWDNINKKPLISIHLNIIDGYSLANLESDFLTKASYGGKTEYRRIMNGLWIRLLLCSYIFGKKREEIKKQLKMELHCQIKRVIENLPKEVGLRLDSHLHTHMLPIVFDAMLEALEELGVKEKLGFVRLSDEPLWIFLREPRLWGTYSPVSVMKNLLLKLLSVRARRILANKNIKYGSLWGLIMTGEMDSKRVEFMLPKIRSFLEKRYVKGKNSYMEVLCHPGITLKEEVSEEFGIEDSLAFFSNKRDVEYEMLFAREI